MSGAEPPCLFPAEPAPEAAERLPHRSIGSRLFLLSVAFAAPFWASSQIASSEFAAETFWLAMAIYVTALLLNDPRRRQAVLFLLLPTVALALIVANAAPQSLPVLVAALLWLNLLSDWSIGRRIWVALAICCALVMLQTSMTGGMDWAFLATLLSLLIFSWASSRPHGFVEADLERALTRQERAVRRNHDRLAAMECVLTLEAEENDNCAGSRGRRLGRAIAVVESQLRAGSRVRIQDLRTLEVRLPVHQEQDAMVVAARLLNALSSMSDSDQDPVWSLGSVNCLERNSEQRD